MFWVTWPVSIVQPRPVDHDLLTTTCVFPWRHPDKDRLWTHQKIALMPQYVSKFKDVKNNAWVTVNNDLVPPKTAIDRWFRQYRSFLNSHCNVTTIDLWRHANVAYWHCDVIFADCSCTPKLAQRRSSLVNNNREYRYLTTRYPRLSV